MLLHVDIQFSQHHLLKRLLITEPYKFSSSFPPQSSCGFWKLTTYYFLSHSPISCFRVKYLCLEES